MYQVRALLLTKDDLWSKGMIQQVYLDDTELATLFCLGVMENGHWEPLRIQGKIGYAYHSELYAQEICSNQSSLSSSSPRAARRQVTRAYVPLAEEQLQEVE
jgi:hypothetical protein